MYYIEKTNGGYGIFEVDSDILMGVEPSYDEAVDAMRELRGW